MPHQTDLHAGVPDRDSGAETVLFSLRRNLDRLASCRESFGLRQGSIAVLAALVSFLPREASRGMVLVWPSNASLSRRAHGMEERTLRRHLARLCASGFLRRKASGNGKRFALRGAKDVLAAFGFDLSPLLERADEIAAAETARRERDEEIRLLRLRLRARLRQDDGAADEMGADLAEARRLLRRKTGPEALRELLTRLLARARLPAVAAAEMSASDGKDDRQLQRSETEISLTDARTKTDRERAGGPVSVSLGDCLEALGTSRALWPSPIRDWHELASAAATLAPMVGIGAEVAEEARRSMGALPAAISILCLIERGEAIRVPGAYLRRLSRQAEEGSFSLAPLLRLARAAPERLAASRCR